MSDVSVKSLAVKVINPTNIQDIEVLNLVFKMINNVQIVRDLSINIENNCVVNFDLDQEARASIEIRLGVR
tara:strand:- start:363 stop:575 length:213 start_codon:yes stop_codon:yes gene_type:complete